MFEDFDAALVLGHGADGDADPFGEFVGGHGADDDALLHHGFEDGVAVADFDEDEVGVAGDVFEAHGGELVLEVDAAFVSDGFGFGLVVVIEEAGEGGGLGEGVGVEGLAGALEDFDEFGWAEAVADAEAGEALDFGEGAEDDDVAAGSHVLQGVGGIVDEFVVGFVEDDDDVGWDLVHEAVDLLLGDEGAGGVVGVGDEDFFGVRRDGGGHGVEVVDEAGVGDFDGFGTEDFGHEFVNEEGVAGGDDVVTGFEEGVADEFDDFIGAAAEDDIGHVEAEFVSDGAAEFPAAAIGVDVGVGDEAVHGFLGLGGGAEGVFIGGQLDDGGGVEAEFTGDVLDGFAGFVGDEVLELGVGVVPEGHGILDCGLRIADCGLRIADWRMGGFSNGEWEIGGGERYCKYAFGWGVGWGLTGGWVFGGVGA